MKFTVKTFNDGSIYAIVNINGIDFIKNYTKELYIIYDDDTESLCETEQEREEAFNKNLDLGFFIGFHTELFDSWKEIGKPTTFKEHLQTIIILENLANETA